MKIVFLCGSLEPGRDGVGDYTRRLASELIRQNHQAVIIALHDSLTNELEQSTDTQQDGEQVIPTLRMSNRLSWANRVRRAKVFIKAINPDWISLQYVLFSFHEKGLPFGLSSALKQLSEDRPIHIMFHELWVGMSIQSPKRHVWWGQTQRYLICSLLNTLHPNVIHTHTHLYQIQLGKLGVRALLLPLFANIPRSVCPYIDSNQVASKSKDKLKFVFFGGIFAGSPAKELADEVAVYANKNKISVDLTIIGRNGPEQETWAAVWHSHGFSVHMLGEQSATKISKVLSQSSIGLATTPAVMSGKSGSVAAMHAHSLPVLCVSQPWQPRGINELKAALGTFQYSIGNFNSFMANYSSMNLPYTDVADVTRQLVNDLSATSTEEGTTRSPLSTY